MNNKFPDQSGHAHINVLRSADFLEIDFLKKNFSNTFRMTNCSIVDY